jgi:hypothetical protein
VLRTDRPDVSSKQGEQGGLSSSVAAKDDPVAAGFKGEADIVENGPGTKANRGFLQLDQVVVAALHHREGKKRGQREEEGKTLWPFRGSRSGLWHKK